MTSTMAAPIPRVHQGEAFHFSPDMDVAQRSRAFLEADGNSVSELLGWMFPWDDKTIVNKDGSLMACFRFDGMDMDSTGGDKLNSVRSQLLYAVSQLQEQRMYMSWQVRRRRTYDYPQGSFPEPVSDEINALLKASFLQSKQYLNSHHVCLVMEPPLGSARLLSSLVRPVENQEAGVLNFLKTVGLTLKNRLTGHHDFAYEERAELEEAVHAFEKVAEQFLAASTNLGIHQLKGDDLAGFLTQTCSPMNPLEPVPMPDDERFLDTSLPKNWIDNSYRDVLAFSGNRGACVAASYTLQLTQRKSVQLDLLDALMAAPFEFTLAHVFQFLPRSAGQAKAAVMGRYHAVRKYPIKSYLMAAFSGGDMSGAPVNAERAEAAQEAQTFENQIAMGQAGNGLWHGTVMVQSPTIDELRADTAKCEEILQGARLLPIRESLHKLSSFCATIPGSHSEIARWFQMDTENLVDMAPIRTVASGDRINDHLTEQLGTPCSALLVLPTRHRTPYYFTGYVGDLGHVQMIGPAGTGKTTFCNLAWTAYRKYPRARVLCFDKNFSVRPPMVLQGGHYIDLTPENQQQGGARMSPLRALLANGKLMHLDYCLNWVELLAKQRGYRPTADDRLKLESVMRACVEQGVKNPEMLRLSTIVGSLNMQTAFAQSLMPWTEGQALGAYFDNREDNFDLHNLGAVEMASVLGSEELAAPFMSYAFYRIASSLRDMGTGSPPPTLIYIPEAWYFIKNPVFQGEFFEWLVTLRKLNACVWLDTQSPDQLVASGAYSAFRDNIATTIFTPNYKALSATLRTLYLNEFLLSEEELQFIAEGVPKQDYFIKQGQLSRRVGLPLNPQIMACLRSDKRAQSLLEQLQKGADPHWRSHYIQTLGAEK